MPADVLEVVLMLRGLQQFVAGAEEAAGATKSMGSAAETSGKKAGAGWKGMVKWAAGTAVLYGGVRFIKSAVDETEALSKQTMALTKIAGLDTQTASEWIGVTKERSISARAFQTSIVKLSKTMSDARGGTQKEASTIAALRAQIDQVAAAGGKNAPKELAKLSGAILKAQTAGDKARATMTQLGISQGALAHMGTEESLLRVADSFQKMKDPQERAALAQKLFGRAGVQLLPILTKGRKGVEELLAEQKKNGAYLTGGNQKAMQAMIQQMRVLEQQFAGIKIQLTVAFLPVVMQLAKVFIGFLNVIKPVTSRAWALKLVIILLVGAFIAYKAALVAAWIWQHRQMLASIEAAAELKLLAIQQKLTTVWTWALTAAQKAGALASKAWAGATWLLNAAMEANPIGVIVIAVIALGVAFYEAYTHIKVFRDVVNAAMRIALVAVRAVWAWVKTHWPLLAAVLLGPFAVVAVLIATHLDQVKSAVATTFRFVSQAASAVLDWFKQNWPLLLGILTGPFGLAVALIVTHFGQLKTAAGDAFGFVTGSARAVWDWVSANWPLLLGVLTGPFGLMVSVIATHWAAVKRISLAAISDVKNAILRLVNWVKSLPSKLGSLLKKVPGVSTAIKVGSATAGIASKFNPLATGGLVTRAGGFLVGEGGPEIVALPAGAAVSPLPPVGPQGTIGGGHGDLVIQVPVTLDGREIARSTARVAANRLARR